MKLILLSGGSGKRLWPLSNDSRSKQFLKVLTDPFGENESMVQRVWRQVQELGFTNDVYITTSKPQVEIIQSQIGQVAHLLVEPERMDTFPAIALAATYLYSVQGISLNESIAVMPVDHYAEEKFFEKIKELETVLHKSEAELALMGVRPTYPSEKFGYIIPVEKQIDYEKTQFLTVKRFQEKPREEEAALMIGEGALWNCGVFAFKLDYLINLLISMELPIQYDEMLKQYSKMPKISFDYQVVERARNIVVAPFDGKWKDLGTWNTLTEEMIHPIIGKGIISDDSQNTHLINELDIPVTVLGLPNIIVATSPDGILVSEKSASPRIKNVLKHVDNRPMYEERRWGHYKVIDFIKYSKGNEVLTKRICIKSGKNLSYQFHQKRSEVWTIISGVGEIIINERIQKVMVGDVIKIQQGDKHSIRAESDLEIIEVQTGSELLEEDIIRISMTWEDILMRCT